MGCRRETKKAIKNFWGQIKPAVAESARDIVVVLENQAFAVLDGTAKERIAVEAVKQAARREGQELKGTLAKALVNGMLATVRDAAADLDQIGVPDDDED